MSEIKASEIELVSINSLIPHEKNNNKHPKEQLERLVKIIEFQGFRNPLTVQKGTNKIVCGHGRWEAAKMMGMDKVPVIYQEFDNEAQLYAHLTADNAIASWSELDLSAVNTEMLDLGPDLDIDMLGIEDFVIEPVEKYEPQSDEDEVPDVAEPITVKGDVWLLGRHRLMCGDSTMIDDVEKLMNGEKADMVFTDPPYGYKYESNYQAQHKMLKNDDVILDFMPVAQNFMHKDSSIYVCTSHQSVEKWIPLVRENFNYKNMIIWKKNNWSMGDLKGSFAGQHEIILFATKGDSKIIGKRDSDVWCFDREPPKLHPTMKPIDLIEYALSKFQSGRVADFFGGSGSTLITCEKNNKQNFSMELDEKYCDVIIKRWQNYTGQKATLESTGQTYEELCNERK